MVNNTFMTHKKKIVIIVLIVIIVTILCLFKSCNKIEETYSQEAYLSHIIASSNRMQNNGYKLLHYISSLKVADCEQDVANQLSTFSEVFKEESEEYHRLTYLGEEEIVGVESYHNLSKLYAEISKDLDSLVLAINNKESSLIEKYLLSLKDIFKEIEGE